MGQALWHVRGVDAWNRKISDGFADWFLAKQLQIELGILSVNVLKFCKLLGKMLLSLPLLVNNKEHSLPMPATFMLSYLLNIKSSPFEASSEVLTVLEKHYIANSNICNRCDHQNLRNIFIRPNNEAINLPGYTVLRTGTNMFTLEYQDITTTTKNSNNNSDVLFRKVIPYLSNSKSYPAPSSDYVVRIVEIRLYSPGFGRMVAIIETVNTVGHPKALFSATLSLNSHTEVDTAYKTCRFVVLDIVKLAVLVQSEGRPPPALRSIEIVEYEMWRSLASRSDNETKLLHTRNKATDSTDAVSATDTTSNECGWTTFDAFPDHYLSGALTDAARGIPTTHCFDLLESFAGDSGTEASYDTPVMVALPPLSAYNTSQSAWQS